MSSKRHRRRKQCSGKVRYESIERAQGAANLLWVKGLKLRAYGCRFCGGFHVGHMMRKVRRKLAAKRGLLK